MLFVKKKALLMCYEWNLISIFAPKTDEQRREIIV